MTSVREPGIVSTMKIYLCCEPNIFKNSTTTISLYLLDVHAATTIMTVPKRFQKVVSQNYITRIIFGVIV